MQTMEMIVWSWSIYPLPQLCVCSSMLGLVGQTAWHFCVKWATVGAVRVALAALTAQSHRVGEVEVHSTGTPRQVHSLIDYIPEVAGLLGVWFQGALVHRILSTNSKNNYASHFMHLADAVNAEKSTHLTFFFTCDPFIQLDIYRGNSGYLAQG